MTPYFARGFRSGHSRKMVGLALALIAAIALARASASSGIVTTIAGGGSLSGEGEPALQTSLFDPQGIDVASDGTIYVAESGRFRVRRISPDGTVTTVAGIGAFGDSGDGGPATGAAISGVVSVALDEAANALYLADLENHRVRRVDLSTGIITTVAGGGFPDYSGDGGLATEAALFFPVGVAVDSAGIMYIADTLNCVVRRVSNGIITTFAGNGGCIAGGDGGPATDASFSFPSRVATDGEGNVYIVDRDAGTVRRVDATTGIITRVAGGGASAPATGGIATSMAFPLVGDVTADAAGNIHIATFTQAYTVNVATGVLTVVAGTGTTGFSGDGGEATAAQFHDIAGIDIDVSTGALLLSDSLNGRIRSVASDAPPSLVIDLLTSQTVLDEVEVVPGNVTMIDVDGRTSLVMPILTTVGGDVVITYNDDLQFVDLGSLQAVGGDVIIEGNLALQTIDLSSVTTINGDVTIVDNGAATVRLGAAETVNGDVSIESSGSGTLDVDLCASGSSNIIATGYASVSAMVADTGSTTLTLEDDSVVTMSLGDAAFSSCVAFAVTRVPVAPESGTDANGAPATIDPIDAYQFEFAVPTLGAPATLTFEIVLDSLEPARRLEVLEALAAGQLTMVTKGSVEGSAYQAFHICDSGEDPTAGGCVQLERLGTDGLPTTGTPAILRFTNVVGHFSTWAVGIVTPAARFNGLLAPYPAPPQATTPVFQQGRVLPLKFNWVDAAGAVLDSAAAQPAVAIHVGSCSDQPPAADSLAAEDAGQSGWQYDAASRTWTFGWSTRPLSAGCFWIQVTAANPAFPSPLQWFPVALQDR